jgi:GNAT superfamily N-acetyltransferase
VRGPVRLRPLTVDDAPEAELVAFRALSPLIAGAADDPGRPARGQKRIVHLTELDPPGAWCAEDDDGRITGIALALVRDGLWGLSLLAVDPRHQTQGLGRALLDAALTYAEGTRGQIILSSTDPRAMRRYARAGFALVPAVAAAGIVDRTALPAPHPDIRAGTGDDLPMTEAISRAVRGATHVPDIPNAIARGDALLVLGDRGFALHRDGVARLLAATDEEAAAALLWAIFAAAPPGATATVDFITAGHDWAVRACLDAGLALSPDGPVFVRGEVGPLRPYIPSGAYL